MPTSEARMRGCSRRSVRAAIRDSDGLLAAGMYGIVIALALLNIRANWPTYAIRTLVILAALANGLGVYDMSRLGAWCCYCLLTTALSPVLVWVALRI